MMAPRFSAARQAGFTLVEVTMTSALMLVVLAMVLPLLWGSINTFENTQVRSDTNDAAQLAMGQIQHDVVSSNVLYIDAGGIVHLQVFNGQTSATTVVTTVPLSTCVEYQVAGGALERRTKAATAATWPSGWSNVMTGVVNSSQAGNPAVFSVTQDRSLVVNLWVNVDTRTANAAAPSQFTSTFTGRAIPDNVADTTGAPC
jgi:prepilin-type N-terminal cleavage/methylation domain-containing protein